MLILTQNRTTFYFTLYHLLSSLSLFGNDPLIHFLISSTNSFSLFISSTHFLQLVFFLFSHYKLKLQLRKGVQFSEIEKYCSDVNKFTSNHLMLISVLFMKYGSIRTKTMDRSQSRLRYYP